MTFEMYKTLYDVGYQVKEAIFIKNLLIWLNIIIVQWLKYWDWEP